MADLRARFDRYDPDILDGQDLKARADKRGRSVAEQIGYEEGWADGAAFVRLQTLLAERQHRTTRLYGHGPYTRDDRFGVARPVDPIDEDRLS